MDYEQTLAALTAINGRLVGVVVTGPGRRGPSLAIFGGRQVGAERMAGGDEDGGQWLFSLECEGKSTTNPRTYGGGAYALHENDFLAAEQEDERHIVVEHGSGTLEITIEERDNKAPDPRPEG